MTLNDVNVWNCEDVRENCSFCKIPVRKSYVIFKERLVLVWNIH